MLSFRTGQREREGEKKEGKKGEQDARKTSENVKGNSNSSNIHLLYTAAQSASQKQNLLHCKNGVCV